MTKEFELEELFEKIKLKCLKKDFNKQNDVSKRQTSEFDLPLVNAKDGDNGIMYYGRSKDFQSEQMTIDIVSDGATAVGNVYVQSQNTGVLYNAYLIKSKVKVNETILLFFATLIQKAIKLKYSYNNKAGWDKVKKETIELPIKNGEIDYEYMENFIKQIKKKYVIKLKLYL